MKKRWTFLLFAALALASCMPMEIPGQAGDDMGAGDDMATGDGTVGQIVHFRAVQTDTKAQFGAAEDGVYPTLWTTSDSKVKLSLNYGGAVSADVSPSADFRTATFDAAIDFTGVEGPFTFYSVSPASAAAALSPSREAWKVTIPCEQTPSEGSVDEAGIILAATSIAYGEQTEVDEVELYFDHLTAYGRLTLDKLPDGTTVTAVELTTTTPIVGDWYWNTSGTSITDYGASSTLTIHTARSSDIWFACAPVDVSGEILSVTVYTDTGSYERLLEFPDGSVFEAGRAAVFSVDMDPARDDVTFTAFDANASADPMLSRSDYGCYLGAGFEWVLDPATNQVTRAYDNGVLTYSLINPSEVEELEVTGYTKSKTKGDQFTVYVQWRKGSDAVLSAPYSVTLVKEEGPKVWLSDGAGNGFIIKK